MVEKVSIGTATNIFRLQDKGWTAVGMGPLLLTASNQILYALSDSIPEGEADEGFVLLRGETMHIPLAKGVWVAARSGAADVYVAGPEG